MQVSRVALTDFRNYERADIALAAGLTIVHGSVGAGKTSLLEGIYFGCVGRSCKTANDRELVRFGSTIARVDLTGTNGEAEHRLEVLLQLGKPKQYRLDGVAHDRLVDAPQRPLVCVFLPDRLELVKGPAATRRAHLDAVVAAIWPARAQTRSAYGRALVQRNALIARARARSGVPAALGGWNRELARNALALTADRSQVVELVAGPFSEHARALGLAEPTLRYRPRSRAATAEEFERELEAALDHDLERGFTTFGPHRDELAIEAAGRELRRFGSQGQQRLALLALLLAERDALSAFNGAPPLLLLDDVLSELDTERRDLLLGLVRAGGQALITTADAGLATVSDAALLRVEAGRVDG
jgi:DNA replication and repair protein RecF